MTETKKHVSVGRAGWKQTRNEPWSFSRQATGALFALRALRRSKVRLRWITTVQEPCRFIRRVTAESFLRRSTRDYRSIRISILLRREQPKRRTEYEGAKKALRCEYQVVFGNNLRLKAHWPCASSARLLFLSLPFLFVLAQLYLASLIYLASLAGEYSVFFADTSAEFLLVRVQAERPRRLSSGPCDMHNAVTVWDQMRIKKSRQSQGGKRGRAVSRVSLINALHTESIKFCALDSSGRRCVFRRARITADVQNARCNITAKCNIIAKCEIW